MKKVKKDFVDFYHKQIEYYSKQRKGVGITQTDMTKARADVKEFLNSIENSKGVRQ